MERLRKKTTTVKWQETSVLTSDMLQQNAEQMSDGRNKNRTGQREKDIRNNNRLLLLDRTEWVFLLVFP